MTKFLQTLIDSMAVGSLYALIALGYTMVYGILKFINFAHSDVFMLGAWLSYIVARTAGWAEAAQHGEALPLWAGLMVLPTVMLACGLLGFTIERLAYRPLRSAPRLNVLITAIGVSLFLENTGQLRGLLGTQPQSMPVLLPHVPLATVANVQIHLVDVIGFSTAIVLMLGLEWLVQHTKIGRGMRAVSFDTRVASLMGVPVDAVISFTFVLGSMLAAAAGFLYSQKYTGLNQPAHATWLLLGLTAFVAAVIGGIGNVRGAMLGGFFIGLVQLFGVAYLSPQFRDIYVFSLLILVLLVRPTGILGKAGVEKV